MSYDAIHRVSAIYTNHILRYRLASILLLSFTHNDKSLSVGGTAYYPYPTHESVLIGIVGAAVESRIRDQDTLAATVTLPAANHYTSFGVFSSQMSNVVYYAIDPSLGS